MVAIARAVLLGHSRVPLVAQDAASASKASFPVPSVRRPVPHAHNALQIQTRPPEALPRLRASATLVAQETDPVHHAHPARQASTRWLLAAAPVQRVKQTRIQQMWAPLASKPACAARQIQEAPPGRALQPRVCAIPARRAPPVALAQSVKQGNTNLSLAALHVPSAGPIRTRRRLGPRHKKPARHVRRRRRAQQARAF